MPRHALRIPAAVVLALMIGVAGCGQGKATVAAPKAEVTAEPDASAPARQASAGTSTGFLPAPQATIDHVKKKLDAAAEKEQQRRDAIELQTK